MFFYPQSTLLRTPADIGLRYQDVSLTTRDDVQLHGWHLQTAERPWATVVFFHGNAENISTHLMNVFWLPSKGVEVYLFDYRGYGASEGSADLDGVHIDAEDILTHVLGQTDEGSCRFVLGQSLGAAISVVALADFVQKEKISGIVLDSGFADYRTIAEEKLAAIWFTRWAKTTFSKLFDFEYSPRQSVARITPLPLVLAHGSADTIVPVHHALELFAAANEPKQLWLIENGQHTDLFSRAEYRQRFLAFMQNHCAKRLLFTSNEAP